MTCKAKLIWKLALSILGLLFVLHPAAIADQVYMKLDSVPGYNMGGVYTSPYIVKVSPINNFNNPNARTIDVLRLACDDFTTDISVGYVWLADEYTLADVHDNGPQKFQQGNVYAPDTTNPLSAGGGDIPVLLSAYSAAERYYAAALLVNDLFHLAHDSSYATVSAEYSYAIWQVFYWKAYDGYSTPLSYGDRVAVDTLERAALTTARANGGDYRNLDFTLNIYTPDPVNSSQEFLGIDPTRPDVLVPDGSVLSALAFDLLALFGVIVLVRKRILQKRTLG